MRRRAGMSAMLLVGCVSPRAPESRAREPVAELPASPTPTALVEVEIPAAVEPSLELDDCRLRLAEPLRFEVETATIASESSAMLVAIASIMVDNPRLQLVIEGHTHNRIPAVALTTVRSEWLRMLEVVEARLVAAGIDEQRLSATFMSSHEPIADNATAEGRARNSRIEFRVVGCDSASP